MSDGEQLQPEQGTESEPPVPKDFVLDLNFVPAWARRPPGQDDHKRSFRDAAEPRRDDKRMGRGGPPRRGPDRRRDNAPRREREERPRRPEPPERLPLSVSFLPEQKQLAVLVRQLRASKKAYPLINLTALFSSKPDYCCVKLEARRDSEDFVFYQCKPCRALARDRWAAEAHAVKQHLGEFFDVEETEDEAPPGQFVCVARCGMSGILLGPPNHHSYAEKLQEIHRTRFASMPLEAYRAKIEVSRDPELIERWRQEARRRTLYRLKNASGADGEPKNWAAAEAHFIQHIAPSLIVKTARAILPVSQTLHSEDPSLRMLVQEAWQREVRSPRSLLFSLRAAVRNRHLRLFQMDRKGRDLVSAVEPVPLDTTHAVEAIRRIAGFVQEHPRCKRPDLIGTLAAGHAPDSAKAGALLSHLTWLVEKGHLIEFFDGSFAVATAGVQVVPAGGDQAD